MSRNPGPHATGDVGARQLRIGSARNLRDIGGYRVASGGSTRWRALLRSDSLHDLSPADQSKLAAYGVRTVIDLRRFSEVGLAANQLIQSAHLRYIHVPFGDSPLVASTRTEFYRLALHQRQREFQMVFTLLAREDVLPAVLQCSAGTDRTGLVVALVLALLDVPAKTIAEDYALSDNLLSGAHAAVPIHWMLDTLRYLEASFGGVRKYLATIGVTDRDLNAIQTALLQ